LGFKLNINHHKIQPKYLPVEYHFIYHGVILRHLNLHIFDVFYAFLFDLSFGLDQFVFIQKFVIEFVYRSPKKKFLYDTGKMDASQISPEWLGYFLPVLYRYKISCMVQVKVPV
jgi:hypothetical protein